MAHNRNLKNKLEQPMREMYRAPLSKKKRLKRAIKESQKESATEVKSIPALIPPSFEIKPDSIVKKHGFFSDFLPGVSASSLIYSDREIFFLEHPNVKKLLEREGLNPILKEKEREGEHYLTVEVIALVLHLKQVECQNLYKTKQVFVIDNDMDKYVSALRKIQQSYADGLIVFFQDVQAILLYVYHEKQSVQFLFLNSDSRANETIDLLIKLTEQIIAGSSVSSEFYACHFGELVDYSNGNTMILSAGLECIRQGKEVFAALKKIKKSEKDGVLIKVKNEDMPLWIRKIGSEIAAVEDKYRYLHELEFWLKKSIDENISNCGYVNLPNKLKKIIYYFAHVKLVTKVEYIEFLKDAVLKKLNYTDIDEVKSHFSKTYVLLQFAAAFENFEINDVQLREHANKLLNLMDSFDNVVKYLSVGNLFTDSPVMSFCEFELPKKGVWDRSQWQKLIFNYGKKVTSLLEYAPEIEKEMRAEKKTCSEMTLKNLHAYKNKILHENKVEDLPLAQLCSELDLSDAVYKKSLQIIKSIKRFDVMPEITIDGKELSPPQNKYLFKKLPASDYRNLFIGEYTSCCQKVSGAGEPCVVASVTSMYSCNYVVVDRNDRIVAFIWAWIGKNGAVVFDSLESHGKKLGEMATTFLLEAAERLVKEGFRAVYLGKMGNTPVKFSKAFISAPAIPMLDVCHKTDANKLAVLKKISGVNEFRSCVLQGLTKLGVQIDESKKMLSDFEGLTSDKLYELFLFVYRSGYHLFQCFYQQDNLIDLLYLISHMSSDHLARVLNLKNSELNEYFFSQLGNVDLHKAASIICDKIDFSKQQFIVEEAIRKNNGSFLELIFRSFKTMDESLEVREKISKYLQGRAGSVTKEGFFSSRVEEKTESQVKLRI